jgi:hypothetical protein
MGGQFTGAIDAELQAAEFVIDWIRFYSVDGIGEVVVR